MENQQGKCRNCGDAISRPMNSMRWVSDADGDVCRQAQVDRGGVYGAISLNRIHAVERA